MDYSTNKLARVYLRNVKRTWRYSPYKQEGFYRDLGASRDYWLARETALAARAELDRRGVFTP